MLLMGTYIIQLMRETIGLKIQADCQVDLGHFMESHLPLMGFYMLEVMVTPIAR